MSNCPVCGKEIPPRTHGGGNPKLFCSEKCRKKQAGARRWQRKKAGITLAATPKKPPAPVRLCPECGEELGKHAKKYCSQECWMQAHLRRMREQTAQKLEAFNATRTCKECGGPMTGCERKQIFCSRSCRSKEQARKHSAKKVANAKKWKEANPEKFKVCTNATRYRRRECTPPWLTEEHKAQIRAFYAEARRMTRQTGVEHHVDHIHPLNGRTSRGLHVPWNLQVLRYDVNIRKSNSMAA